MHCVVWLIGMDFQCAFFAGGGAKRPGSAPQKRLIVTDGKSVPCVLKDRRQKEHARTTELLPVGGWPNTLVDLDFSIDRHTALGGWPNQLVDLDFIFDVTR